jgi:isoquinoline 1-oxidoreductase subunit alpha
MRRQHEWVFLLDADEASVRGSHACLHDAVIEAAPDLPKRRVVVEFENCQLCGCHTMIMLTVNGTQHQVDLEPDTPLLWALRDAVGLTGTKFGCGIAQCGACTVHVDGQAMRSCSVPIGVLNGANITTIEGLSPDGKHPVQQAWLTEDVPQCGYCQSGQIMATAAFLKQNPNPTDADINASITNICRCGTYERLRRAIHRAADLMKA